MTVHLTLAVGECRESEKIHSLPIIEGVIVALRTLHARSKKQAHGVGEVVQGHAFVSDVISDGSVFPQHAFSRDQLTCENVKRHIVGYSLPHPVHIRCCGVATLLEMLLNTQHIKEPVTHVALIAFGVHQIAHQQDALVGVIRFEIHPCFLNRGNTPYCQ